MGWRVSAAAAPRIAYSGLAAASVAAVFLAACIGAAHIPPARVLEAMTHAASSGWESLVVRDVRVPRAIVAYLVGGALAVSGGALQGVFRNPLAEPGVLGVSNGAALGAVIAIFGGAAAHTPSALPLAACAGALAVTAALVTLAARGGRFQIGPLLLSGVALANLAGAGTTLFVSMALANYDIGRQVMNWLMGGLEGRTWSHVAMGTAPILAGVAVILANARNLDALLLGDVAAEAVGVSAARVRFRLVIAAAVLTGVSVAIGGAIAFVGLIAPHVVRRFVGTSHVRLLPACFLGGGVFLVLADIVARTLLAPEEMRLGVVTAAVGAPFFLWLLAKRRPREAT
jgi:iron complex transport system permease protein